MKKVEKSCSRVSKNCSSSLRQTAKPGSAHAKTVVLYLSCLWIKSVTHFQGPKSRSHGFCKCFVIHSLESMPNGLFISSAFGHTDSEMK